MEVRVVNFEEKFQQVSDLHSYKIIAQLNITQFKIVRMKREFIWHSHEDTDEAFLVVDGRMSIDLRDRTLSLGKGELSVIPKGVEHRPWCVEECHVVLIEPAGTVNTGNAGGALTDTDEEWI